MSKDLIIKKHTKNGPQEAMEHFIKLDTVLHEPVTIRFISVDRKRSSIILLHGDDKIENTLPYPLAISYEHKVVTEQLTSLLEPLGIYLSTSDKSDLITMVNNCLHKLESRYGIHVKNYTEVGYSDAVINIKGDNGKEKRRVFLIDKNKNLDMEEFLPDSKLQAEVESVSEHIIVWTFDKDIISSGDLLNYLQGEFENPYLIISPFQNILLDFSLDTKDLEQFYKIEKELK